MAILILGDASCKEIGRHNLMSIRACIRKLGDIFNTRDEHKGVYCAAIWDGSSCHAVLDYSSEGMKRDTVINNLTP